MKIDLRKAKFTERFDNDSRNETQMFFDLPEAEVSNLLENNEKVKQEYDEAVKDYENDPPYKPHLELQLYCGYGELFSSIGYMELGIGIDDENGTEVLTTISLIPGVDFNESDAEFLWNEGLKHKSAKF